MKEQEFIAGELISVGNFEAFLPNPINHEFHLHNNKTLILLEQASTILGKLNYLCEKLPLNMYISMLILIEALNSSAIEGTHASAEEVLSTEKKSADSQAIENLFDTINTYYSGKCRNNSVTTLATIEDINKRLFKNVKNKNNTGKVRKGQNFIGGSSELSALYVPPPAEYLQDLLQDLEDFWENSKLYIPNLIKIAIYHYQFETIHPFNDGNGRTGRLLINLQMKEKNILNFPVLCLSKYWGKNKGLYYDALTNVRFSNDIEHWIRFFLESLTKTIEEQIKTITEIDTFYSKCIRSIESNIKTYSKHKELLKELLKRPTITISRAMDILDISYQNANKIVQDLVGLEILKAKNNNKRNRVFELCGYYDLIFKGVL